MSIFQELQWRGMVHTASEGVAQALTQGSLTAYIGFDPTASSLHVGSLLPIMTLARLQKFGHSPIAVVGGGTGLIGDPSGKVEERGLLTIQQVEANLEGIKEQLARFLDFGSGQYKARILNNAQWLLPLGVLSFLREIGKHFNVNYMLDKDSVQRRLQDGLSYTEFTYMLLQAYDFLVLHDQYGCRLQMGGSDQWGNITAGLELIRKVRQVQDYGLVLPLVTNSSGIKFGKTEAGTIWLDATRTSPYKFFQFWYNTDDRDVISYLRYFTWMGREEIAELERLSREQPEQRLAQKRLAQEVTKMVHGNSELDRAEQMAQVLFGKSLEGVSARDLLEVCSHTHIYEMSRGVFENGGVELVQIATDVGLVRGRNEARHLIRGGGLYVNNIRVNDFTERLTTSLMIEGQLALLRKGQHEFRLIRLLG